MGKKSSTQQTQLTEEQKIVKKRDAFARVVPTRVNNAVRALRLLKQCSSSSYLYTDEQARAVVTAVENEVNEIREAFSNKEKKSSGFILPDA